MCKQPTHLILLIMVLVAASGGAAFGFSPLQDPALIGWWTCDEGAGNAVADSSSNGNDGTFYDGDPVWVPGVYGNAVELTNPTLIEIPAVNMELAEATMAGWIKPYGAQSEWASIMMTRGSATGFNVLADYQLAYHWADASNSWSYRGGDLIVDNEWTYAAVTVAADEAIFYVNGVQGSVNTVTHGVVNWNANIYLGGDGTYTDGNRRMTGALDDVSLFSRVLSEAEIASMMMGLTNPVIAAAPSPEDGATDVLRDADLSWTAGESAASHDVYLGTSFEDVNDASRDNPMDVLVSEGQAATTFDPGRLEFGQMYYWRVDEVNAAPDNTIFKGMVWSFTVEPLAYPIENIIATSNTTSDATTGPENTVNGSGLNAEDGHSIQPADMWLGTPGADPAYIQYEFDAVYKLHQLLVWNYNVQFEMMLGFGLKDVTIEYSENGTDWVALGDVELVQGTTMANYAANTTVDFGGVAAKFVKLTVNSSYGVLGQYGLSEVRFLFIPVLASAPQPGDGAANVAVETALSWRAGREAASHDVSLSTDEAAVADGAAVVDSVDDASYAPAALDLATTYFWKVDEVNEVESISTWPGKVWSFDTQAFLVVDDFEGYTEVEGNRVYEFWVDGWDNGTGSTVGTLDAPFTEQTIVNGGGQSMPVFYDNAGLTVAEAVYAMDAPQDWTASGIKSLSLYFYGAQDNTGQLYIKINGTKVVYDGGAGDLVNAQWQPWNIDLSTVGGNLSNVTELTIGIEGSGAAGVVYIDDIRLYPDEVEVITPVEPDAANLILHYALDEGSGSVVADSSGNGNDGTIDGSPAWITGVTGSALGFDGSRDYITTGKSLLNGLPAFTISCWLKGDLSMGDRSGLVGQNDCIEYGVVSANTIQIYSNGEAVNLAWPYDVDADWHSVVAVGDGTSVTMYLDGKAAATGGSAITDNYGTSTFPVNVGGGGVFDATDNWFTGDIDEIRIYQRALSAAEVAGLAGRTEPITMPF